MEMMIWYQISCSFALGMGFCFIVDDRNKNSTIKYAVIAFMIILSMSLIGITADIIRTIN